MNSMRISTLSIGDELICGQTIDTNAAELAAALIGQGMTVQRHVVIADQEQDIIETLQALARISDAVIVTGGLGPTADDLTSLAAARATGRRLVVNEEARAHIISMMPHGTSPDTLQHIDKQALLPSKTSLIPNPTGTACGFHLMYNSCFMFFLPGVPSEMRRMLHDSVLSFLQERIAGKRIIRQMHFNVLGPSEAAVDRLLSGIAHPAQGLHLGICVSFPWMRVTLRAEAVNETALQQLLEPAAERIREQLGDILFSEGAATLEETVATLLDRHHLTLSLAESCTGGMIAQRITSVPGSSHFFPEGVVTYSNSSKTLRLGVDAKLIEDKGAVSSECASAMAKGIRASSGSSLGLAVTGIAGPDGGTDDKPVGTVFISLAASDGCWTKRFQFCTTRHEIRTLTAWTALDWLRRYLSTKRDSISAAARDESV